MIVRRPWFKAKTYGWGWTPATWQGWLVLAVYLLLIIHTVKGIDSSSHSDSDVLMNVVPNAIILTLIFIGVCYLTGETPRWRWGKKKS